MANTVQPRCFKIDKIQAFNSIGIRDLLLFYPEEAYVDELAALNFTNWKMTTIHCLDELRSVLKTDQFRVGIFVLHQAFLAQFHEIKELFFDKPYLKPIALVSKPILEEDPTIRAIIRDYFYDYHTLPVDWKKLLTTLGHAYGMSLLQSASQPRSPQAAGPQATGLQGQCASILALNGQITKAAALDIPILITGETGTGKELVARAIHQQSAREQKPWVVVNCATLPPSLIQVELFGCEKGAYTGASQRRIGYFEVANGGTLFFDEIGDLPGESQILLLRFLEEKTIERVGGRKPIPLDVRIIAATHVDLEAAMTAGRFREDLYFRLNVIRLKTPPLRERSEDIEILAYYFLEKFSREYKQKVRGFTKEALQVLRLYDWPGNVRELINRIQQAVIMGKGCFITPENLGLERRTAPRVLMTLEKAREKADQQAILNALQQTRGNVIEAAETLGISRASLYRLMEKYNIKCHIN